MIPKDPLPNAPTSQAFLECDPCKAITWLTPAMLTADGPIPCSRCGEFLPLFEENDARKEAMTNEKPAPEAYVVCGGCKAITWLSPDMLKVKGPIHCSRCGACVPIFDASDEEGNPHWGTPDDASAHTPQLRLPGYVDVPPEAYFVCKGCLTKTALALTMLKVEEAVVCPNCGEVVLLLDDSDRNA